MAAGQVLVLHSTEHLRLELPSLLTSTLSIFPGVPIFFVISGFLVADAYQRNPNARTFFINRSLRIFPGLWGCFLFGFVTIGLLDKLEQPMLSTLLLFAAGNLIGLPHTPAFLQNYGAGSFNGSLWTIPVELQFYAVLPMLLVAIGASHRRWLIAIIVAITLNLSYLMFREIVAIEPLSKILRYSIVSWIYMFMLGMALQANRAHVDRFLKNRFVWWLLGYIAWTGLLHAFGVQVAGNTITPLSAFPLACLIVSAAFTQPDLATRLLHNNDISYGLYLYHMPIVNIAIERGYRGDWAWFWSCVGASVLLAYISWRFIERPALGLKSRFSATPVPQKPSELAQP